MTDFLFNKTDTAKIFGISVQAFNSWAISHTKRVGKQTFYYLPDVVAYRLNRDSTDTELLDLTAERARLTKEQADKTATENKRLNGSLVETSAVMDLWMRRISNLKTKLLNIPAKAAPVLVSLKTKAEVQTTLETCIHETLCEIANSEPLEGIE